MAVRCARHFCANQHGPGGQKKKQSKKEALASDSFTACVWQAMNASDVGGFEDAMHALGQCHGGAGVACAARIRGLGHPHRVLQHASLVCTRRALIQGCTVPRGHGVRTTNAVEAINACTVWYRGVHTVVVLCEGIARSSAYLVQLQVRADEAAECLRVDPEQWLHKHASQEWCKVRIAMRVLNVHFVGDGVFIVVVGRNGLSTGVKVDINLKSCGCGV